MILRDKVFSLELGKSIASEMQSFYLTNKSSSIPRESDLYFILRENNKIVASVRFCVEYEHCLLRTMLVDSKHRKQGLGSILLTRFNEYLEQEKIIKTYCLPYEHLKNFYAKIGFRQITEQNIPQFLNRRMSEYKNQGLIVICMERKNLTKE
ncbi:MAG: GNAT family N-acetyltransferase [Oligoflexia bacterium]|nr:GNAT family N-acetyltransferase [Oligoflexia bacterium]